MTKTGRENFLKRLPDLLQETKEVLALFGKTVIAARAIMELPGSETSQQ